MASLPESWGLRERKTTDGKAQIVGTNEAGQEYVARTCDGPGLTDHDLKILDVGNPNKRDKDAFIGFYRGQRDNARKTWEHSQDEMYMAGAEQVVHAGLHLADSSISFCHIPQKKWDAMWEE